MEPPLANAVERHRRSLGADGGDARGRRDDGNRARGECVRRIARRSPRDVGNGVGQRTDCLSAAGAASWEVRAVVANIVLGCVERMVGACGSEPSERDHATIPLRKRVSFATWIPDIRNSPNQ